MGQMVSRMLRKRRLSRSAVEPPTARASLRCVAVRLLSVALAGAVVLALSGFLSRALRQVRYDQTILVPLAPSPGYAYLQLAERQGLADARRLALVAVPVRDPQEIVRGYLEGRFAIAPLTTVEALQICQLQPQRCPRLVLILVESRGADKVVVRPSAVNLEGLRGQKVAVVPTSLGPFLLGRALGTVGMGLKDVTMVPAQPDAMPRLLHRGEVEGAALYVPYSEHATRLGTSQVVFDSTRIPGEITVVLAAAPELLRSQPAAVARLLQVWQDAHDWAARHRQEAAERLGDDQNLSATGMRRAEAGLLYLPLRQQLPLLRPDGRLQRQIQQVRHLLHDLEVLPAAGPLPEVDDEPLRQALAIH
jgi:NitT/TauT family transport system substrate-binding protein